MAVPTWSVGQVLTASDVNTWLTDDIAYKTSTTTRTTTTRSLDPDLQLSVLASSIYVVRLAVIYTSTTAMAFGFNLPSGASGGYVGAFNVAGTGFATPWGFTWTSTPSAAANGGTVNGVLIQGVLQTSTTAGTFGFNWASDTSATSLTIGVGSCMVLSKSG